MRPLWLSSGVQKKAQVIGQTTLCSIIQQHNTLQAIITCYCRIGLATNNRAKYNLTKERSSTSYSHCCGDILAQNWSCHSHGNSQGNPAIILWAYLNLHQICSIFWLIFWFIRLQINAAHWQFLNQSAHCKLRSITGDVKSHMSNTLSLHTTLSTHEMSGEATSVWTTQTTAFFCLAQSSSSAVTMPLKDRRSLSPI